MRSRRRAQPTANRPPSTCIPLHKLYHLNIVHQLRFVPLSSSHFRRFRPAPPTRPQLRNAAHPTSSYDLFRHVMSSATHTSASGQLLCWGRSAGGRLGLGLSTIESKTAEKMVFAPAAVEQVIPHKSFMNETCNVFLKQATDVASVSAGGLHTLLAPSSFHVLNATILTLFACTSHAAVPSTDSVTQDGASLGWTKTMRLSVAKSHLLPPSLCPPVCQ